jgi:hypothetical protein
MAKYTAGSLAGVISGKIGTIVFSRGRYGLYMRNRALPTRRSTVATREVRGRMSSVSKAWAALDVGEKAAWKTWAATNPVMDRLGASRVLQPNAAFIQLNARLIQAGGTQIDMPPVAASPAPLLGLSVTIEIGGAPSQILEWTSGATGVGECVAVWAAVSDSPGRDYYKNQLKLVLISGDQQATQLGLLSPLNGRFGTLIAGQRVFIEAVVWDNTTGLISGKAACETIVTDTP